MEIYITWAQLLAALSVYLVFKYLRSCNFKLYNARDSPLNPFIPYESPEVFRQWERGYLQGKLKMKLKHQRQLTHMFTEQIKEISDQVQNLTDELDSDRNFLSN